MTMINEIVASISELPPFPKVAQRLMSMTENNEIGADKLAEVVQLDASITANMLKVVNSAMYALPRKVDNLKQALALLGTDKFREVVLTSFTASMLNNCQPGYDMPVGELWRHSLATALMTKILAKRAGHKPGPALYTAALLHDIGKVVLSTFVQDKVPAIMELVDKGSSFLEAEQEVLGLDHAQLGALIAKTWHFTDDMIHLIEYHHHPEKMPDWPDLATLYLSDVICELMGFGVGVHGLAVRSKEEASKLLGLKEIDLEHSMMEIHDRLSQAEAMVD